MTKLDPRNGVVLRGEIDSVGNTEVNLKIVEVRPSGTYENPIDIQLSEELTKKLKKGQFMQIMGKLDRDATGFTTKFIADEKTYKKTKKSDGCLNEAVIVGRVPISAAYMPPAEGRAGVASLTIEFDGKIFNGVCFRQMAVKMDRVWKKGAIAQLKGRLRKREFEDGLGNINVAMEIVAEDSAETRVLKAGELIDNLNGYGYEAPEPTEDVQEMPPEPTADAI